VIMDENMDLVAASQEAFSMFGMRLDVNEYKKQMEELSASMAAKTDLFSSVGASTFKLRHVGSKDTVHWQDDNRFYDITVFTLPAENGMHFGVHFADTTARIESEKSRDTARTYLEGILNSIPLGVVVMNRLMQVTAMNNRQQEIMKILGQDISLIQTVGMDAPKLFISQPEPSWEDVGQKVMNNGETVRGFFRQICGEDGEKVFLIEVAPLKNDKTEIVGAVRICQDITVQTRLEEQAREAGLVIARLETVKQVAVTLNHEINNALAVLMGNLDIIDRCKQPIPEIIAELLTSVREQATRIGGFVERFSNIKEVKTVKYLESKSEQMIDL
jgi:nitrogen fixation/metabolism regulation signal transduction histidine kinase